MQKVIALCTIMTMAWTAYAQEKSKPLTTSPLVVAELFTSEGCSSCPPADEFMADLQARQNVLPLSYHVDYWDYIGWKDRFADPRFTERQRYYSSVFGSHTIYTPQMVINGTLDVVGSDHDGVDQAIDAARHRLTSYPITLTRAPDGRLHAALPQAPLRGGAKIWLIAYQSQVVSHADVGENAGRALRSYNVVRSLQMIGRWTGEKMEIALPEVKNVPHDHLALLVNQDQNGQVVAATSFQP